jgi:DNA-directed RNA polymerase subunit H
MAAKKKEEVTTIIEHVLVPKHEKISQAEAKKVLEDYNISLQELPKILSTDPGIRHLGAKTGDIIKITRDSKSSGEAVFYRTVVGE